MEQTACVLVSERSVDRMDVRSTWQGGIGVARAFTACGTAAAFPFGVQIAGFHDVRMRSVSPVPVTIDRLGDAFYVYDNLFCCWGSGRTLEEARLQYESNVYDTYVGLLSHKDRLAVVAKDRLAKLAEHVTIQI